MPSLTIEQAFELAMSQHRAGNVAEAESLLRQIIQHQPQQPATLYMLGILSQQTGRHSEAVDFFQRAIGLYPHEPEWHNTLAKALLQQNQIPEALQELRQAITLRPDFDEAFYNLGAALQKIGDFDKAIAAYRQAIAIRPNYPEALNNLANNFVAQGKLDEATQILRQALHLVPQFAEAHYNLGCVYYDQGNVEESINEFRRAVALRGTFPDALCSLGNSLKDLGHWDQAIRQLEHALALEPNHSQSQWNLANLLLLTGELGRGFELYESRWKKEGVRKDAGLPQPLWDGSDLKGRRILLRSEQGLGDVIQFIRYAPLVSARGGRVVVAAPPALHRLLAGRLDIEQLVAPGDPLPEFDVQVPLMSLPELFQTTLQTIPAKVPYLFADPVLAAAWKTRITAHPGKLRVGLVWRGSSVHKSDRHRSFPLSTLAPLAEVANVSFYSLQKGEAAKEAQNSPPGMELIDWTDQLADFADTAALVWQLDLVIACDTAIANLAGAMGTAVWVLLPFVPDWRWMLDRTDSPWYPTMRLFRQHRRGDWTAVVQNILQELQSLVNRGPGARQLE